MPDRERHAAFAIGGIALGAAACGVIAVGLGGLGKFKP